MVLAVATFVESDTQLAAEMMFVEISTTLVFPTVNPEASNANFPVTNLGRVKVIGTGF